jgi:selenocysteine lyase/cysteine desulfurase
LRTATRRQVARIPHSKAQRPFHRSGDGLEVTVRPSYAFYNTFDEIDVFLNAVRRIAEGGTNVG